MQAVKTEAIVSDAQNLHLLTQHPELKQGETVEIIILQEMASDKTHDWKTILNSIGTYSEEDLASFTHAKQDIDKWEPTPF